MAKDKAFEKQNVLNGAMILVVATALVKIIGAIYKIPLTGIIGSDVHALHTAALTPLILILFDIYPATDNFLHQALINTGTMSNSALFQFHLLCTAKNIHVIFAGYFCKFSCKIL